MRRRGICVILSCLLYYFHALCLSIFEVANVQFYSSTKKEMTFLFVAKANYWTQYQKVVIPTESVCLCWSSFCFELHILHYSYTHHPQDPEYLKTEADKMGYPVLIKAIKGGGGKGMRIVEKESDFMLMLESAKREATKHFGDDAVLVEKYIVTPRLEREHKKEREGGI